MPPRATPSPLLAAFEAGIRGPAVLVLGALFPPGATYHTAHERTANSRKRRRVGQFARIKKKIRHLLEPPTGQVEHPHTCAFKRSSSWRCSSSFRLRYSAIRCFSSSRLRSSSARRASCRSHRLHSEDSTRIHEAPKAPPPFLASVSVPLPVAVGPPTLPALPWPPCMPVKQEPSPSSSSYSSQNFATFSLSVRLPTQ